MAAITTRLYVTHGYLYEVKFYGLDANEVRRKHIGPIVDGQKMMNDRWLDIYPLSFAPPNKNVGYMTFMLRGSNVRIRTGSVREISAPGLEVLDLVA